MAGPGQAPAPYDGMGTPTRWDASTHDDGAPAPNASTPHARIVSLPAPRGMTRAKSSCADRSTATTSDHRPNGSTLERGCDHSSKPRRPDGAASHAHRRAGRPRIAHPRGCRHDLRVPRRRQPLAVSIPPDYPELHHVLVRHEQGGAHAADGYARSKRGSVGVVFATSGPGALNLVTGLATAYMDSVPVVAITGQVPSTAIGTDSFQESDVIGSTMSVVKHSYLITRAEDIAPTIKEAFHIARTGRPGPVLIDFPKDLQAARTAFNYPEGPVRRRSYPAPPRPDPSKLRRIAAAHQGRPSAR